MKIVDAVFVKSCGRVSECPSDSLPEVACVGRSNVGKSSLINSLLHRRSLAKVSRTPGKTRLLNFFRVTIATPGLQQFYLVDLPGYGYAKVSKSIREQWGPMIERYFAERQELRGVLLLVDARGVQEQDTVTLQWLRAQERPTIIVATKIDKFSRDERVRAVSAVRQALHLTDDGSLISYSSVTREGVDALWRAIRLLLGGAGEGLAKGVARL